MNETPEGTNIGEPPGRAEAGTDQARSEQKRGGLFYKHFVEPFVTSRNPPWFDARGVAVGLAVGFGMPVGAQVITVALLRVLFRFNSMLAVAFTLVSNPFNFVPMYYGYYRLGCFLLGRPSCITREAFQQMMAPLTNGGYFWESMQTFLGLSRQFLTAWLVAAVLLTVVSAVVGYVAAYYAQRARCRRRAEQVGISYEKLIESLEKTMGKQAEASKATEENKPPDRLSSVL